MPPINLNRIQRKSLPGHVRLANSIKLAYEKNPFLPIVVHTIERGLRGGPPAGELDQVFARVMRKYPRASKEWFQKFVEAYKQLDPSLKARVVPQELLKLDVSQPLPQSLCKSLSRQPVPIASAAPIPKNLPRVNIQYPYKEQFALAPRPPVLNEILADFLSPVSNGFDPGEGVVLTGQHFSEDISKNKILIYRQPMGMPDAPIQLPKFLISLSPFQVSPLEGSGNKSALFFMLPSNLKELAGPLTRGFWVEVVNLQTSPTKPSNRLWFELVPEPLPPPPPPPPKPEIYSIDPPGQLPGKKVIVSGKNFSGKNLGLCRFSFQPLDGQSADGHGIFWSQKVKHISDTQIELTLPIGYQNEGDGFAFLGGNYGVKASNTSYYGVDSDVVVYRVSPCTYRVIFEKMRCVDESDPETIDYVFTSSNPHDEIATFWTIAADDMAWAKNSREYTGFDDNVSAPYSSTDRTVYMIDGAAGPAEKGLVIRTRLMEIDEKDVQSVNETIGSIADITAAILKATGKPQYAVFVEYGAKVVQWFISLGGAPDNLGEKDLIFTPAALQEKTDNPSRSFNGVLQFHNDDETGSYELFYRVVRIE